MTKEKYEDVIKAINAKLNQLSAGMDPELLSLGIQAATYHVEAGTRAFGAYARVMVRDLGDRVKPYLKAWYNGVRDMPEMEQERAEMTPYAEVEEQAGRLDEILRGEQEETAEPTAPPEPAETTPEQTGTTPTPPPATPEPRGSRPVQLSERVKTALQAGDKITNRTLQKWAREIWGKTTIDPKDKYDALELGLAKHIQDTATLSMTNPERDLQQLDELTDRLPPQRDISAEAKKRQQYSTPPRIAYMANYVANTTDADTVLEPSAGTGMLAVWPQKNGARVIVNEQDAAGRDMPRVEALKELGFDGVHNQDAKYIAAKPPLAPGEKFTTVVMNPPFSSDVKAKGGPRIAQQHIQAALNRLEDGGRLVVIGPGGTARSQGMADQATSFLDFWNDIKAKHNVRANVEISGKEYAKFGTSFETRIAVIDKTGPTPNNKPQVEGRAERIEDLIPMLEEVRNDRQRGTVEPTPAEQEGTQVPEGTGGTRVPIGDARPDVPPRTDDQPATGDEPGVPARPETGGTTERPADAQPTPGDRGGRRGAGRPTGKRQEDQGGEKPPGPAQPTGTDTERPGTTGPQPSRRLKPAKPKEGQRPKSEKEFTDSIWDAYEPTQIHGLLDKDPVYSKMKPYPGALVESAAMAAVHMPALTYRPELPERVVAGDPKNPASAISDTQLEAVAYIGQAHERILPDGSRQGFLLGDGTGVGKTREIIGALLDNFNSGTEERRLSFQRITGCWPVWLTTGRP